jgi:Heterokaryon incompatibility protein (HET)
MGRIYSESKNTIAWLGLPMDDSDLAIDRMIEFDTLVEREEKHRISMSIERKDRYSGYLSIRSHLISFLVTTAELDAVIAIANRSYWSRMWIIQEIQLHRSSGYTVGGNPFHHHFYHFWKSNRPMKALMVTI